MTAIFLTMLVLSLVVCAYACVMTWLLNRASWLADAAAVLLGCVGFAAVCAGTWHYMDQHDPKDDVDWPAYIDGYNESLCETAHRTDSVEAIEIWCDNVTVKEPK